MGELWYYNVDADIPTNVPDYSGNSPDSQTMAVWSRVWNNGNEPYYTSRQGTVIHGHNVVNELGFVCAFFDEGRAKGYWQRCENSSSMVSAIDRSANPNLDRYGLYTMHYEPGYNLVVLDLTGLDGFTWIASPYSSRNDAYTALSSIGNHYPITYRPTNCTFPNAPTQAGVGDTVIVPVSFTEGYGIVNNSDIYVTCNGVTVPSTYNNGTLTFTMPDPSQ